MHIVSILDKDGDGFEYDVIVSDGKHNILCFADSKLNLNDKFELCATLIKNVKKAKNKTMSISKTKEYFGYHIIAEVIDVKRGIVKVFNFEFELGEALPEGISFGDFIDINCMRMDCKTMKKP